MKFLRIDLLTLLISLFILSSCKNQDGIGLNPDLALNGTLVVDTNIIINTVPEDTTFTNALAKTPLGYFKDPLIGNTEANIALALNLPLNTAYTVPSGIITVDSAILVLRYATNFYGDSLNSRYKINVYQLNERPLSTVGYYNNYNWNYNSNTVIGSRTFNMRPHTTFKVTDLVKDGPDTLKRVPAHIRVPINPDFIAINFFSQPTGTLKSSSLFQSFLKGLYVTMDKTQAGSGGLPTIALDSSSLAVYYKASYLGAVDTELVALPVSTHVGQIKHTYTAPVAAALANTAASNSTFYVQSPLGLRAKISFPNLKDIVTKAGSNIVINRAELVVTPVNGTTIPFAPQSKISMYQLDIARQRIPLQDATPASSNAYADPRYLGVTAFGGYYLTTNDYHFVVTGYIQDLIKGKTIDYGTYIGAVELNNLNSIDYYATPQAVGRLIAAGTVTDKTSPDFKYKIKLNIIYTKVIK